MAEDLTFSRFLATLAKGVREHAVSTGAIGRDVPDPGIRPFPTGEVDLPDIPRPEPGPRPVEPDAPQGLELYMNLVRSSGFKRGTPEFDRWVLGQPERPDDDQFNRILRENQLRARNRQRLRERESQEKERQEQEESGVGLSQILRGTVETAKQILRQGGIKKDVQVLGPDGQPLMQQYQESPDGTLEPVSPPLVTEVPRDIPEGVDPNFVAQLEQATQMGMQGFGAGGLQPEPGVLVPGQYVWMGAEPVEEDGRDVPRYMSAENALNMPFYWNTPQVLYAQEAFGQEPTGFADDSLLREWAKVVSTAAGYTAAGRNVDPLTVLDWVHNATGARSGGGGGGGGGGGAGGRAFSRSETSAVLNRVMLEEAGREATPEEISEFHAAVAGSGLDEDLSQLAVDWVRGAAGEEAGAFQAATDYYQAMLAVLGTVDQAAEPTE